MLPLLSLYLRRVWMIRNGYMRKHVVHVPMSRNVTTVWMLTWIPNLSLYFRTMCTSWCKKSSYEESSARPFVSLNTVVLVCCDWPVPWPTHQTALLHYGGDDAATLRYCPDAITLLLVCLFHKISGLVLVDLEKIIPEQTLKNSDAKYDVTISGGRQRYNATSTRESLSGANLLQQQQAAARSSDKL